MWVKVISRFKHRETGQYHNPGETLNLPKDHAKHLIAVGCVKQKGPEEDKGAEE